MKKYFVIVWMLIFSIPLFSQNKYTLSGYVKDSETGEDLIGAYVYLKNDVATGTVTNIYGFFSLTLPEGTYDIVTSYIGYETQNKTCLLYTSPSPRD